MADAPETRPSLIARLGDPADARAWPRFVEVYAPLVYGFARRRGLQDADAADVTQEVLRAVARAMRGAAAYDPRRGPFRAWLFAIVRRALREVVARRDRPGFGAGGSGAREAVEHLADDAPGVEAALAARWDDEHRRRLFAWAADRVRAEVQPATWRAFWLTAVEGRAPADVAAELGATLANVYLARSRVAARLRRCVAALEPDDAV